jgi:dCMP deaminase
MNFSWKEYFMLQALMASQKSKDPSTKVGCVIVDKQNKQVGMGYNGFPAGVDESKLSWDKTSNKGPAYTKYPFVIHAEVNAILNASKDIQGCDVYVTLHPCNECAKLLVASKVSNVYYLEYRHCELSNKVLELGGVKTEKVRFCPTKISVLKNRLDNTLIH